MKKSGKKETLVATSFGGKIQESPIVVAHCGATYIWELRFVFMVHLHTARDRMRLITFKKNSLSSFLSWTTRLMYGENIWHFYAPFTTYTSLILLARWQIHIYTSTLSLLVADPLLLFFSSSYLLLCLPYFSWKKSCLAGYDENTRWKTAWCDYWFLSNNALKTFFSPQSCLQGRRRQSGLFFTMKSNLKNSLEIVYYWIANIFRLREWSSAY